MHPCFILRCCAAHVYADVEIAYKVVRADLQRLVEYPDHDGLIHKLLVKHEDLLERRFYAGFSHHSCL